MKKTLILTISGLAISGCFIQEHYRVDGNSNFINVQTLTPDFSNQFYFQSVKGRVFSNNTDSGFGYFADDPNDYLKSFQMRSRSTDPENWLDCGLHGEVQTNCVGYFEIYLNVSSDDAAYHPIDPPTEQDHDFNSSFYSSDISTFLSAGTFVTMFNTNLEANRIHYFGQFYIIIRGYYITDSGQIGELGYEGQILITHEAKPSSAGTGSPPIGSTSNCPGTTALTSMGTFTFRAQASGCP